jgi:hypothetical protein
MSDDIAGETWHAPALLGDVVCDCRDGRHDPHNYIISTDSNNIVRDAILRLRDEAREVQQLREQLKAMTHQRDHAWAEHRTVLLWSESRGEAQRLRKALEDLALVLKFGPDEIDYILDGFDGHEFDPQAAAKGMEMGCITCCQINGLRGLRKAIIKALPIAFAALEASSTQEAGNDG